MGASDPGKSLARTSSGRVAASGQRGSKELLSEDVHLHLGVGEELEVSRDGPVGEEHDAPGGRRGA